MFLRLDLQYQTQVKLKYKLLGAQKIKKGVEKVQDRRYLQYQKTLYLNFYLLKA